MPPLFSQPVGTLAMKSISIVTACYNEEENVEELYNRVRDVMVKLDRYRYEHIFIDNCSQDGTVKILKRIAASDTNVKLIVNARNFGHIRSPQHALYQTTGDAVIGLVADLQDPPEMIPDFIREWENGYAMVLAVKRKRHPPSSQSVSPSFVASSQRSCSSIGTPFLRHCLMLPPCEDRLAV